LYLFIFFISPTLDGWKMIISEIEYDTLWWKLTEKQHKLLPKYILLCRSVVGFKAK